jgi:hypothetical protein
MSVLPTQCLIVRSHNVRTTHINRNHHQTHGVAFSIHAATIQITIDLERTEGGGVSMEKQSQVISMTFAFRLVFKQHV